MEEDVKEKRVQIKITITTREALKHFGIKGESYEVIIQRLMERERVYYYFACNKCQTPLRSFVDNPSGYVKCSNCGNWFFHKITEEEYNRSETEGGK